MVSNLYAARKSPKTDPFFQNKNRKAINKFFVKEFADLIWEDSNHPDGEVGARADLAEVGFAVEDRLLADELADAAHQVVDGSAQCLLRLADTGQAALQLHAESGDKIGDRFIQKPYFPSLRRSRACRYLILAQSCDNRGVYVELVESLGGTFQTAID